MKHAREILAAGTAVALLAGCTSSATNPESSAPFESSHDGTLSPLSYNGRNAPYLLAINCLKQPNGVASIDLPTIGVGQSVGDTWTAGYTNESVATTNPSRSREQKADFIGGITLRRDASGAIEIADSNMVANYSTIEINPEWTYPVQIPNTNITLVYKASGSANAGQPAILSMSCAESGLINPIQPTVSTSAGSNA